MCIYCGVGCGIDVYVGVGKGGLMVAPTKAHPVNQGKLCRKGWRCHEFVLRKDRLTAPLVRKDGGFEASSWGDAVALVAARLGEIRRRHGADALAFVSSAKATNEENYLFQKLARTLGTNNVDHVARLCHSSTVTGLRRAFGSGAMTNPIRDLQDSRCILVIGSNTTEQHPIIASRVLQGVEKGAKLVVIDPRRIHLARYADLYLQPALGRDLYLLNSMAHVILEENLAAKGFIQDRTRGFRAFSEEVMKERYHPSRVEGILGVEAGLIRRAAILYARHSPAAILYAMGITQHAHGTANVLALANLALLTGNLGKRGAGVYPLRGHQNVQGACDMGALPDVLPGYLPLEKRGLTVMEMFEAALEGRIKGMYIMGANPLLSNPDAGATRDALEALDFLVVQDLFMTETAELADVVLPACSWLEKEGTFTSTERRVQRIHKALEPLGKPDWEIIVALAEAMGYESEFKYSCPEEVFSEISRVVPQYRGMTYDAMEQEGLFWPFLKDKGVEVLHRESFTHGKGVFHPLRATGPVEEPDEEYDLALTTGRMAFHFHTGSMTRRSPSLEKEAPEGYVEINPRDAEKRGVADGEMVRLHTRRGVVKLKARVLETIKEGTLFIPFHFAEAAANVLTLGVLDEEARIPEFKVCACRLERAEE